MKFHPWDWISAEILFILALHTIAAAASMIRARREGLGYMESLRWGGIGFISGLLGFVARMRTERRQLTIVHIAQDALLNFGLEVIAVYGVPHLLS